jgi:hypothetical protein
LQGWQNRLKYLSREQLPFARPFVAVAAAKRKKIRWFHWSCPANHCARHCKGKEAESDQFQGAKSPSLSGNTVGLCDSRTTGPVVTSSRAFPVRLPRYRQLQALPRRHISPVPQSVPDLAPLSHSHQTDVVRPNAQPAQTAADSQLNLLTWTAHRCCLFAPLGLRAAARREWPVQAARSHQRHHWSTIRPPSLSERAPSC